MLFLISWKLSLVIMATMPPIIISAVLYGKFIKNLSKRFQDALANASDAASEAFTNIKLVFFC